MSEKNGTNNPVEEGPSGEQFAELKRDMRVASMAAWAKAHQKQLIAAVVAVVVVIVAASLWVERLHARKSAAADLYSQALAASDTDSRQSLMQSLVRDYGSTAYAELALLQLARLDREHAEQHLKSLLEHRSLTQELRWQARLDLAQFYLQHQQPGQAMEWLHDAVGPHYEQMRQFLLAEASRDDTEKAGHYRKALDAISHDTSLDELIKQRLETAKGAPAPETEAGK